MKVSAIGFPVIRSRSAVGWLDHAVVHDLVPVFTGYNTKQHGNTGNRRLEVSSSSDAFAVLDGAKDDGTSECVKENEEKHSEDDEETFAHGYADGQHQHLQRRVFTGYSEESQYYYHESDHV